MKKNNKSIWAIILAAGKGTRMNSADINKVAHEIKGIPMITRTINTLRRSGIKNIIVVVGFAKESVLKLLDKDIKTIEQKNQLGTGHAVKIALTKVPKNAKNVLVLNGDDSFLITPNLLSSMIKKHTKGQYVVTFLSVVLKTPQGLGRVVRDKSKGVAGIIEEKDANEEIRKINEVNAACYLFESGFLRKNIKNIKKSKKTGEFYIVNLVETAVRKNEKVEAYRLERGNWRGVNTLEELKEAERLAEI